MIDIKKVIDLAKEEVNKEREEKAKHLIKGKLKQINDAKKIITNLERELEDLYAEISNDT